MIGRIRRDGMGIRRKMSKGKRGEGGGEKKKEEEK